MKILLMDPPWYVFMKGLLRQPNAPLGSCYLAAVLEQAGFEVAVFNSDLITTGGDNQYSQEMQVYRDFLSEQADPGHPVWQQVERVLRDFAPDVLGLTVRTPALSSALHAAALAKQLRPDIKVVLGGPHPTVMPDDTATLSNVDAVVCGEGEQTILDLVRSWDQGRSLKGLPGVSYWDQETQTVVHGPKRPLIEDLDTLPFPAKHLIVDRHSLMEEDHYCTIMFSRGCPARCIFCSSPAIWTRRVRFRSAGNMIKEMLRTHEQYNTRFFSFQDDTFTVSKKRISELCEEIIASGLTSVPGFRWACNTRPELVSEPLLEKMYEAGCAVVAIGVESGNDDILKKMKKGYTTAQVREAARMIKASGLTLSAQFLIGMPFETEAQIWDTYRLAEELEPVSVMLSVATPLPGTELYQMSREMGYFQDGLSWEQITTKNDGVIFNRKYPRPEVERIIQKVQQAFDALQERMLPVKNETRMSYERLYKEQVAPAYGLPAIES
ncbi:MAG: B12-binding domain-containing radical SAM protein [Desulfobaccales bacterium]